jgi:hypothetical protein
MGLLPAQLLWIFGANFMKWILLCGNNHGRMKCISKDDIDELRCEERELSVKVIRAWEQNYDEHLGSEVYVKSWK